MVFPLYDDNTGRRITPFVNYVFIVINIAVFVFLQGMGTNDRFTYTFSTVPREIVTGEDIQTPPQQVQVPMPGRTVTVTLPGLQPTPISVYITLLTSMFMHGGIAHIFGNMLFLWIFGDNIEDALGHVRYVIFYLVCGLAASLAQVFTTVAAYGINSDDALIPSLGASGAISGVLGGYVLLFPHRRVTVIMFRVLTEVPAWVALGLWFLFQLISGLGVLGEGSQRGGVAYAAHIGGFVVGLALIKVFAVGRDTEAWKRLSPARKRVRQ